MNLSTFGRVAATLLAIAIAQLGALLTATGSYAGGLPIQPSVVEGAVMDGSTPICNSSLTLYAAGLGGYGKAAINCGSATSSAQGQFSIKSKCALLPEAKMYLIALGGSLSTKGCGAVASSPIGLAAALGQLPQTGSNTTVVNELTTVASILSLAQFVAPSHPESIGTPLGNILGLRNAFSTVPNLVDVSSGQLASSLPAAGACTIGSPNPNCPAEQRMVTLADALAACVEAGQSSTQCGNLFASATPPHGAAPTDTLGATAGVVLNPATVNVSGVFNVAIENSPYGPSLSSAPTDWIIALNFTGGGMDFPFAVEVDGYGQVWITNSGFQYPFTRTCGSVTKLSSTGKILSGPNGYTGGGILTPLFLAIDSENHVWVTNSGFPFNGSPPPGCSSPYSAGSYFGSVTELDQSGQPIADTPFTDGIFWPMGVAIDFRDSAWVANNPIYIPILTANETGTTVTVTTAVAHNLTVGQLVQVIVIGPFGYDGVFYVTATPSPTTFEYTTSVSGLASASGGAATVPVGSLTQLNHFGTVQRIAQGGGLAFPIIPAIDGFGNVWMASCGSDSIPFFPYYCTFGGVGNADEFNFLGTPISGAFGYNNGVLSGADGIAIDSRGNIWVANLHGDSVSVLCGARSHCGSLSTGQIVATYSGEDLDAPDNVIIDGGGNAWLSDCGVDCGGVTSGNVVGLTSSGTRITPPKGFNGSGLDNPSGDAIDASGNVWVSNGFSDVSVNGGVGSVTEMIGVAVPAQVPLTPGGPRL